MMVSVVPEPPTSMPALKVAPVTVFAPPRMIVALPAQSIPPVIVAPDRVMVAPSVIVTVPVVEPVRVSPLLAV